MAGKQVIELDALPSFTDNSLLPVHNGAGLKKGLLSQLSSYLGTKFSNPNLLINPDFKINQRGVTSYEQQGYSVDRWKIWHVTATQNTSGEITVKNDKYTDTGTFLQYLENATEGDSTLSCYVTSVSGTVTMEADDNSQVVLKQGLNIVHTSKSTKAFTFYLKQGTSITLKWTKLEQGKVATPFISPNPAEEMMKCQRYLIYAPSCMVGYRFDTYIYVYLEKLKNMRIDGTCTIRGINNDTSLLSNGEGQNGVSLGTNLSVVKDKQFIRIDVKNISTSFKNKVIGIDMNNTFISIDAEIY